MGIGDAGAGEGLGAIQDGQPVRRDAMGKTVLMNSHREETALEAWTFVPADLYFLDKIPNQCRN